MPVFTGMEYPSANEVLAADKGKLLSWWEGLPAPVDDSEHAILRYIHRRLGALGIFKPS